MIRPRWFAESKVLSATSNSNQWHDLHLLRAALHLESIIKVVVDGQKGWDDVQVQKKEATKKKGGNVKVLCQRMDDFFSEKMELQKPKTGPVQMTSKANHQLFRPTPRWAITKDVHQGVHCRSWGHKNPGAPRSVAGGLVDCQRSSTQNAAVISAPQKNMSKSF